MIGSLKQAALNCLFLFSMIQSLYKRFCYFRGVLVGGGMRLYDEEPGINPVALLMFYEK